MKFTIIGAGVLGSILGAQLGRAGHDVTVLARGQRAGKIRAQGLQIRGLTDVDTRVAVVENAADLEPTEVTIIATKTPGTEQLLRSLSRLHTDVAFSIQNGVHKNELLAATFGRGKTLGALADTSGEVMPSGEVWFTRNENLAIGELDRSSSERASNIAAAIDAAGVRSHAVADIVGLEWSKFVAWAGLMMLAVITRRETWKYLGDPDAALLLVHVMREMGALARAEGVTISDRSMVPAATILGASDTDAVSLVHKSGLGYKAKAPHHRMSALQDLDAGRPLEIHETIGAALMKAAKLHIPMPQTQTLYHTVAAIDRLRNP